MIAAIYGVVVILVSPAWAGQGWYLLSPNIGLNGDTLAESKSGKLLTDEPISKWREVVGPRSEGLVREAGDEDQVRLLHRDSRGSVMARQQTCWLGPHA